MLKTFLRWPARTVRTLVRTYSGQPEMQQKPIRLPVRTNPWGASLRPTRRKTSISIAERAQAQREARPQQRTPPVHARTLRCETLEFHDLLKWGSAEEAAEHPLGRALFAVPGVHSALILAPVVAIAKSEDASWESVLPAVETLLQSPPSPHGAS